MNWNGWRMRCGIGLVSALMLALLAVPLVGSVGAQAAPGLTIVSPSDGATITTDTLLVQLNVTNFKVDCSQMGRPDQSGVGQILALIDGTTVAQLTNFYCTDNFTVPLNGLTPGPHKLAVVLASNTHVPMMDTAKVVTFNFQPIQPIPLPAAFFTGAPTIKLVSPTDGATVPPEFPVQVQPTNFHPTTDLEGRLNVAGYGHYHVWVDAPAKPTSLANLVLMPGTNGFTLDLSAWGPGKHTIRIEAAQNDHTMYDPQTSVTFTVNVSATATPAASPAAVSATAAPATTAPAVTSPVASPAASPVASAGQATVIMNEQLMFSPQNLTIKVGQTVTFINKSSIPHTATDDPAKNPVESAHPEYAQLPSGAAPWDSGTLQPGQSYSHTFTVAGTYDYFCIFHVLSGMRGTITVTS